MTTLTSQDKFKKECLANIMEDKIPFWNGIEIEEINFSKMTPEGELEVVLDSGKTITVSKNEINFN
jgi:hypothetical protein